MNKNELLNDYIGPNYISFLNGGFSFACLFFTWIYLFYRKQYKLAFILMFLTLITNVIYYYSANYMIYIFMQIILLAITFFIAVSFKKEYVKKATEFINQKRNEGIQGNDLKLICQKAGGVDYKAFLWMVIMGIANFSLSFITASALNKQELQAHFPKELEGALENRKEDLYKDNGKTVSKMSFTYEDAKRWR